MATLTFLLCASMARPAEFAYQNSGGTIKITQYLGQGVDVVIPDSIDGSPVTAIGSYAFSNCRSVTNVTIPESVTLIEARAFDYCDNLAAITVAPLHGVFASVDGVLLNKSLTTVIRCPPAKPGAWSIPNSVSKMEDWAFVLCERLTSVTIGTNVTSIADHAFDSCTGLTNVTIPNSVINIGEYAFACALSLKVVTIPDSVLEIRARAFSVSSVEAYYFQGSTPSVIPNIFEDAFASPVIYHLPGASGWGPTFAGCPTAVWLPRITTNDEAFGVRSNQFGFNIDWASGQTVVIEASAGGSNPIWLPISTNKLVSSTFYFADPGWTNHPTRFYRLRSR